MAITAILGKHPTRPSCPSVDLTCGKDFAAGMTFFGEGPNRAIPLICLTLSTF